MADDSTSLAPLSLYLDLEPGETADLDVVAKAALAWSAAIKEIAYVVDPSLHLRIELESGTAGSLSLNAKLRSVAKGVNNTASRVKTALGQPQVVTTLVITASMWLLMNSAEYTFTRVMDYLTGADAPAEAQELSEEDKADIARRVVEAMRNEQAKAPVRSMYRELERDPAVRGAGLTSTPGKRPDVIVLRAQFASMAGHVEPKIEMIGKRVIAERTRLVLVRPVLERGDRRWGFKGPFGEFGAAVKHHDFIESVLSGTTSVPMMEGIEMTVDLETTEELQDGVWAPVKREVVNVADLHQPYRQDSLFPPSNENRDAADDH